MSNPDPALPPQPPPHEAILAAIVESSDDAIISKDLNGIVTSWNPAAGRLFGYSAAEMVGRPITVLFPFDRMDEEPQILERLRRGERADHFVTIRLHKSGRPIHVSVTISPVKNQRSEIVGASKIARDITAQKQSEAERERLLLAEQQARAEADKARRTSEDYAAELQVQNEELQSQQEELGQVYEELQSANEDLQHQQEELQERTEALGVQQRRTLFLAEAGLLLASSLDPEVTLQSLTRLAVPAIADWCAVDMAETDGKLRRVAVAHVDAGKIALLEEIEAKYPSRREESYGPANVLRTGKPELFSDVDDGLLLAVAQSPEHLRLLRQLGLVSGIVVPITAGGQVLGALTLATAESNRRYGADDLAFAQELAQRAGLAVENARLYSNLQEADQQKDRFLAMLAHELRNPLAAIANAAHILEQIDLQPPMAERLKHVVSRQTANLGRMADDLLDVARIRRGSVELQKELVELGPVVERAVEATRPLIDARQHSLSIRLSDEPLRLLADATRVEQIVANLLNNAAKFTDRGGQIWLTVDRERDEAVIRVRDTGAGIPRELLPRVFDLFTQGNQSLARSAGGLGIGLTLVKNLAELHDGHVAAHSEGPGSGSEFEVRLPTLREARRKALVRGEGAAAGVRRVLVVDDDPDSGETLADLLRFWGQEVEVAYHGPGAINAAAAFHPEVVFCDLGLPGMDGYEVAAALRRDPWTQTASVIALTGYGGPDVSRRCREAGFDLHLTKPVEPEELRSVLSEVGRRDGASL